MNAVPTHQALQAENEQLRQQLNEANDTIYAIRTGQIDALVVESNQGHELYTLATADQTYRVFIETMNEGALTLTGSGLIVYANSMFASMVGRPLSHVIGTDFGQFVSPACQEKWHRLLTDNWTDQHRIELYLLTPGGAPIPCLLSVTRQHQQEETSFSLILTDLTDQKKIETLLLLNNEQLQLANNALEESNNALNVSNDSLQQFAYVASHDLQEPLRKIQQFGGLLKSNFGPELGPEGADMVERMGVAAGRMSLLIKDLLHYSRLTTQQKPFDPVDLNLLVAEALDTLSMVVAETRAEVVVEPLPTVLGDVAQLRQLMQNLLSNALKFHQPNGVPQVQVRCQRLLAGELAPDRLAVINGVSGPEQPFYQISVTDNGIGFDEIYLERIFQVFQRLHAKQHYPGSGVGLAICRKVAYNHRGGITAHSQPGHGTTFLLYLPA